MLEKVGDNFEIVHLRYPEFRAVTDLRHPYPGIGKLKVTGRKPKRKELLKCKREALVFLSALVLMGE